LKKTKEQVYTLINCTNKYLDEYTPAEENSRLHVTGFTGSVGNALICPNEKILLFVDGRYHQQADVETNPDKIQVIKLKTGEPQLNVMCSKIKKNSVLKLNPEKNSQAVVDFLTTVLRPKNVKIEFWVHDNYSQCSIRSNRVAEFLQDNDFDKKIKKIPNNTLITNPEEISYLCGLRCFSRDYTSKIEGKFFRYNDKFILFTDYKIKGKNNNLSILPEIEFKETISKITEKVYVDKTSITALDFSYIKNPKHKKSLIKEIKSIKTKPEIEHYKYAFNQTDKTLLDIRNYIEENDNLSEYDISEKLHELFIKNGAKTLSFKSIVAINKNSALAHYSKSSKSELLKNGDLVLIDCGAYYDKGLATDITRVFVKGEPNDLQKKIYTTVLKSFLNCYNYKMDKTTEGFDIDLEARKILKKSTITGFEFSHGLGHGIGISVHEMPPNLSKNKIAKTAIKNNMCFTIEPGLYNPEHFGVRLENSCYLNRGKIKSFSNMGFEGKLIDYDLLTKKEKEYLKEFTIL